MSGSLSGLSPADQAGYALGTGTGPHGIVVPSNPPTPMGLGSVFSWLNKPFSTPLSATDLFLITGVIIVSIIAWNLILFHIRLAAETL